MNVLFVHWSKRSDYDEAVGALGSHYPLCPLGLSRKGMCYSSQPPPEATIPGHILKDYPVPLVSLTTGSFSLPERHRGTEAQGSEETLYSSILIPITCRYVTQVMHLRRPAEPRGHFFFFKYPQSKLFKISLGTPEAGCAGNLWPKRSGD